MSVYWVDLGFSFLSFFISWERERGGISTSWKALLGAMKHGESYPTAIIFSLVSPSLTCHHLAPQNLKWLRESMKKPSVAVPGLQRPPVFQLYFMDICIIQSFNHERTKEAEQILFARFETCVHMAWLLHVTQSFKTATPRPSAAPACAQEVSPGFFHAYLQCQVVNDPDTGVHQGPILSWKTHTQVGGDQTDSWSWAMRRTTSVRWVPCLQLECARHPEKGSELVRLVDSTIRTPDSVNIKWRSPLTCKLGSWTGTSFVLLLLFLLLLLLINIISFS